MNNKKCLNCGMDNNINSKFCIHCGKPFDINENNNNDQNEATNQINNETIIQNSNVVPVNDNIQNDDKKGNTLAIISLLLFFLGQAIGYVLALLLYGMMGSSSYQISALFELCPLAAIVTMIIGRVKYPTNKFLKIVMWIFIGCIILGIILMILFMIWCYVTCSNIDTSGCG